MARRYKIALVGCGRIADNHLSAYASLANRLELVGVCDTDPARVDAAAKRCGVPGYPDLASLLASPLPARPEIVALCTPSGLHPSQGIEVARAGAHVVSEKPLGTKLTEVRRLIATCAQSGVQLFEVKQNRYNATIQLLKRAIDQGRFGKIFMITSNVFWTRPQSYYDQAPWRGTWALDGGAFMNQASHYADLITWLFGPIAEVFAFTKTLARRIEAEDTGTAAIRWSSGAVGSLNVTMLTYPKNLEGSLTVLGERGTVRVGGVAVNEILEWNFADACPEDEQVREASYQTESVYGFGHTRYYTNVLDTLDGADRAINSPEQALAGIEFLCAIYESARTGRAISPGAEQ